MPQGKAVTEFAGVGTARARALAKLGLTTALDLVRFFPRGYEDRSKIFTIREAPVDTPVCVTAMVAETPRLSHVRTGLDLVKARAVDGGGVLNLTFFNQAYVKSALQTGESYVFFGKVEGIGTVRNMVNPIFERAAAARYTGRIMPLYRLTAGLSNNVVAGLTRAALDLCLPTLPETLPESVRLAHRLAQVQFSYENIHYPESAEALELARRRLIFEELFYLAAGLALLKSRRAVVAAPVLDGGDLDEFVRLLPFAPTAAQRRAMDEAADDLRTGRAMNRLVQGDVGSGKTAVAAACGWLAVKSGHQCAMMAPTEVLAAQHFRSLSALLAPAGVRVGLLTGALGAAEKRKTTAAIQAGELDFIVGTHALLSAGVHFARLGLVVADEQHRFGVDQRAALAAKAGHPAGAAAGGVHTLVMSATPIPRTLALIIYGDLDISVIDELPPGRMPVKTYVVGEDKRRRMYGFVERLVGEGRQAYIVCPMVDQSAPGDETGDDRKAVVAYTEQLQQSVFPHLRIAYVHGKMKQAEKAAVMTAFAARQLDVLVSTTVIEVGVDNPNAALMIVENAERFGLSQLHQLRGRVGRGAHQSYCVLLSSGKGDEARARLAALAATNDGFRIAEEDLKLRGPGDFFGNRQHGLPNLKIADFATDMRLLADAQNAARALLTADPTLSQPEHRPVLGRVRELFSDSPDIFN